MYTFRADRKFGANNGGSIGSSSSGLGSSGGLLSGDSEINGSESTKVKRENILSELLLTESRYFEDLEQVLRNYRCPNSFILGHSDNFCFKFFSSFCFAIETHTTFFCSKKSLSDLII